MIGIYDSAARMLLGGVGRVVGAWRRTGPTLVVFAYHGVTARDGVFEASGGLLLPAREFARHCAVIAASYRPIGLDAFLALGEGDDPGPYALLTFDDIYDNVAANALPILEAHQLRFLIFLTTGYVGGDRRFWWDDVRLALLATPSVDLRVGRRVVRLDTLARREAAIAAVESDLAGLEEGEREPPVAELREGADRSVRQVFGKALEEWAPVREESLRRLERHPLCQIGLHSHSHPDLMALGEEALGCELARCQQWHRQRWEADCANFCLPFGGCDARVAAALRRAGFNLGFLLDPYRPPRLDARRGDKGPELINRHALTGPRLGRSAAAAGDRRYDLFVRCCGAHRL